MSDIFLKVSTRSRDFVLIVKGGEAYLPDDCGYVIGIMEGGRWMATRSISDPPLNDLKPVYALAYQSVFFRGLKPYSKWKVIKMFQQLSEWLSPTKYTLRYYPVIKFDDDVRS